MNQASAQAILAETMAKVKVLEVEIESLPGKENKKVRNAKSREIAELKKDADFMDAERILVGKEPITPSNKTPQNAPPKKGEYDDLFAEAGDAGKLYVAGKSESLTFTSKKKKEKAQKGLSEKELEDMEKLKQSIMTKKSELKAEGMSGGQINKDSDIVDWVAKLNALKEKEASLKGNMTQKEAQKEASGKKGDEKEIAKLHQDIEDYKAKLKEEFGYSKKEINQDMDLMDMQKRYKEIGGK
jgi:hypothetical protein